MGKQTGVRLFVILLGAALCGLGVVIMGLASKQRDGAEVCWTVGGAKLCGEVKSTKAQAGISLLGSILCIALGVFTLLVGIFKMFKGSIIATWIVFAFVSMFFIFGAAGVQMYRFALTDEYNGSTDWLRFGSPAEAKAEFAAYVVVLIVSSLSG
eukprot:CAMPEP_0168528828 /NCGR_PEP_ID=MMETSP0405-20121227/13500_1 /TAXON_ID=498012 /ORGANISM="Trichosphaerium sp, Strain Am-I-7 wt" /LENGTH=153 /DNA_ID=CAMNT_0008552345 /DNA_START=12 /DNA_END=469 /DNA_ORIENTATION=-